MQFQNDNNSTTKVKIVTIRATFLRIDPDELTALWAQISATTAATLVETAATAHDKIEAEEARNLLAGDLATANRLIAQLTTTRTTNNVPTPPTFCLSPGQMSPDQILDYSSKTVINIYEKAITSFKLTFDGTISNTKIIDSV